MLLGIALLRQWEAVQKVWSFIRAKKRQVVAESRRGAGRGLLSGFVLVGFIYVYLSHCKKYTIHRSRAGRGEGPGTERSFLREVVTFRQWESL
jgi:hypothetical protein